MLLNFSKKEEEIDFDTLDPNKMFRPHKNISRCFKTRFSSRKIEKMSKKYSKFPKHSNWRLNMFKLTT